MTDRRYDRDGVLLSRGEVLRLRTFQGPESSSVHLSWKGPTSVTPEGYKARTELEYELCGPEPEQLLAALGFREFERIDRYVEYYLLGRATIRMEWYPRMDVLLEIEGDAESIEAALLVSGVPRDRFTAEQLPAFAGRYQARTGMTPLLALEPGAEPPSWPSP